MHRRLLFPIVAALASTTLLAAEPPFTCEVIHPAPQVRTTATGTMAEAATGGRHRAVDPLAGENEIDVMEVYGPPLLHAAGSAGNAVAMVQNAVDATNKALSDSGLPNVHLRLRHVRFSQGYDSLATAAPGPELVADRAYYGADLVGFAVGSTPLGIGGAACRPPTYDASCGIHWVHFLNFLQFPLAYVHEVGHNLGADHDAPNAMPRDVDPHPFARAHCQPGQWRTLMSQGNPCIANVVPLFSNPAHTLGGIPTGVAELEDNARVIALSAPLVRNYAAATTNTATRCEFRIAFDGGDVPVAGAARKLTADRIRGDCDPAVSALDPWVQVAIDPASTAAHTEAQITYLANGDPLSRRGFFVVGEQPVGITQSGAGQCLVANGSFDHDLDGWTLGTTAPRGSASWSPRDAHDDASSGSAAISVDRGQYVIQRCVSADPSSNYVLRSSVFMPSGQTAAPFDFPAIQSVSLFDTPDCSGDDLGGGTMMSYIPNLWLQLETPVATSAKTRSAKIKLLVNVAQNPFTTYFDDVYFCKK